MYRYIRTHRLLQKKRIIYVMGGCCALCGYDKCSDAMELHHIDPTKKDFTFSQEFLCRDWNKYVLPELKKCILLCANCHREIHFQINKGKEPFLHTTFIQGRANEISKELQLLKTHKLKYCKFCHSIISSQATVCQKCFVEQKAQKSKINTIDRNILKDKIRNESFLSIGEQYGVTDNTIRKWCIKLNLPNKKSVINSISNED